MSRIGVFTLMMPQSRKPTRPPSRKRLPMCGVAVDDRVRALVPEALQLVVTGEYSSAISTKESVRRSRWCSMP